MSVQHSDQPKQPFKSSHQMGLANESWTYDKIYTYVPCRSRPVHLSLYQVFAIDLTSFSHCPRDTAMDDELKFRQKRYAGRGEIIIIGFYDSVKQ